MIDAFSVTIVTFNSALYIEHCLRHLLESEPAEFPIVVVDNASDDGTREILARFHSRVHVILNSVNSGFAGGQNQAIAQTSTPWILALNPDVRVTPGFISRLVAAGSEDRETGTVCGKLLFMKPDFLTPSEPVIDSTGIYFTPELRHFDRGSKAKDTGQYEEEEFVFGATGAAALYRRAMIDDVSIGGEFFDAAFFAYREDADLSWRAQLLGWKCLYTPSAVAFHVRSVLPDNRRSVSATLNRHSVKNRFLMRIKNMDLLLYRQHWRGITQRDVLILGACLLREWSSLPAFFYVAQHWNETWAKRKEIMWRRRAEPQEIARWFE